MPAVAQTSSEMTALQFDSIWSGPAAAPRRSRVAERREHGVVPEADVADNHLAAMDADAVLDRLAQFGRICRFMRSTLAATLAAARSA